MSRAIDRTELPDTGELIEGLLIYPIGLIAGATVFPGLTLCVPGLIFCAAFVIIPLVVVALVLGLVAAVIAAPFMLVRGIRALRERRAASRDERHTVPKPVTA
jgi:hypothetical protein